MRIGIKILRAGVSLAVLALAAAPAAAQVVDASAVTLGMGGNATATARGLAALSLNPAGLALPGSGFALALAPVQVRMGLHPVTLADLADWDGQVVPASAREEWLGRIDDEGSQAGTLGLDVAGFAITFGKVGFQLSTVAVARMSLAPDVAELVLFGNAGRTGEARDLTLGGSELETFAVSTGSATLGIPLALEGASMGVGVTVKYSVGHAVAAGRETGGTVSADPLEVDARFPIVVTAEDQDDGDNGSGMGLDVGFQYERGAIGFGASVLNLVNTFAWDLDAVAYRPGTVFLDADGSETEFDEQPVANAPADLVEVVEEMGFDPILSVGASYRAGEDLTLAADLRKRLGDGLAREPEFHAGVGAEYRGLGPLALRGGVAAMTGGVQLAGGTSLSLGPVHFSIAGAMRRGDEDADVGQFTLSFGGR